MANKENNKLGGLRHCLHGCGDRSTQFRDLKTASKTTQFRSVYTLSLSNYFSSIFECDHYKQVLHSVRGFSMFTLRDPANFHQNM